MGPLCIFVCDPECWKRYAIFAGKVFAHKLLQLCDLARPCDSVLVAPCSSLLESFFVFSQQESIFAYCIHLYLPVFSVEATSSHTPFSRASSRSSTFFIVAVFRFYSLDCASCYSFCSTLQNFSPRLTLTSSIIRNFYYILKAIAIQNISAGLLSKQKNCRNIK